MISFYSSLQLITTLDIFEVPLNLGDMGHNFGSTWFKPNYEVLLINHQLQGRYTTPLEHTRSGNPPFANYEKNPIIKACW